MPLAVNCALLDPVWFKLTVALSLHFYGNFCSWTWVSRYQDVSFLILLQQRMMEMVI